jgi:transposase
MDTSNEAISADVLGRRTAPRRMRTTAEKRQIVEETFKRGASVAVIARRHEVNANLLFGWRRLYQKGLLEATAGAATALVPVRVTSPTVMPKRTYRRRQKMTAVARGKPRGDFLEIDLAGGGRIRVHGKAAAHLLARLVDELCRR